MDNKYEGYEKYMDRGTVESRYKYEIESAASNKESKVSKELLDERNAFEKEYKETTDRVSSLIALGGIVATILGVIISTGSAGFWGFMFGLFILGPIIPGAFVGIGKLYEYIREKGLKKQLDSMRQHIKDVEAEIYSEVDENVKKKLESYHRNVNQVVQKVSANPSNIDPMVDHSVEMFKRMISHADSDSSKKFIECNFTYVVTVTDIKYLYDSDYTNPRDDFNFEKQRFRNLQYDYECEGFALALAQAVSNKMKSLYPPNTLNMSTSNVDAKVTIKFKAPNDNFVVARDIF